MGPCMRAKGRKSWYDFLWAVGISPSGGPCSIVVQRETRFSSEESFERYGAVAHIQWQHGEYDLPVALDHHIEQNPFQHHNDSHEQEHHRIGFPEAGE